MGTCREIPAQGSLSTNTGGTAAMLDIITCLVFFAVLSLCYLLLSNQKKLPPGPLSVPFVGSPAIICPKDLHKKVQRYKDKYGNVFSLKLGSHLIVVLNGYDLVHEAYVTQAECFNNRPNFLWWVKKIKEGVVWSNGSTWKSLRRFALHMMKDFGLGKSTTETRVLEETTALLDIISQHEGKQFCFMPYLNVAAGNVICSIIFGERFEYDDPKFNYLSRLLNELLTKQNSLNYVYAVPLLRLLPFAKKEADMAADRFKQLIDFVKSFVKDHESTFDPDNIRDFIDLYIQMKREDQSDRTFSVEHFLRLIVDLFFAGTDTTATSVSWALLYMMEYPDVQKKCQKEIDDTIGKGRAIVHSDRAQLPYVQATIFEIQRMITLVPLSVPRSTGYDTTLNGYYIPKDTIILTNVISIHNDPKYWTEPEKFRPERFLDDQGQPVKRKAFMPFSTGPRMCPGDGLAKMELFLYVSNILQRFSFTKPKGATLNFEGVVGSVNYPQPYELIATRR